MKFGDTTYLLVDLSNKILFSYGDFMAKNNSELLANLGNFSLRCLKFLDSTYQGKVPDYEEAELVPEDKAFI